MNPNRNPRGGCGAPTPGTTTPPVIQQGQPGGCPMNQQCQLPTRLQRNRFEGAISELCGYIYDLVGIRSANLFTMTTCMIATYTGCELGGDIRRPSETFTLAMLTRPTRPLPPPPATDGTVILIDPVEMDIYMEEVKEYVKQRHRLTSHNQQLYVIFWGQSTESIHAKVEAHPGFDDIRMESDRIRILNEIQLIMLNVQEQRYYHYLYTKPNIIFTICLKGNRLLNNIINDLTQCSMFWNKLNLHNGMILVLYRNSLLQ